MNNIASNVQRAKALYESKQAHEAIAIMRELILREPSNESHRIQLALYLRAIGNFDESLFYVDKVSPSMSGYPMLKGWHLLRQGKFNEGMQMREAELGIYRMENIYPFPIEKRFTKGTPLTGKKVLLVLEGGNGDEVAYLRFAQTISKAGATVCVAVSTDFIGIAQRTLGVSQVCSIERVDHTSYDYYIPSMSMFSLFALDNPSEQIQFPYINAEVAMVEKWQPILETAAARKLKIGIQWQGNPAFDHVEFKTLPAPLLAEFAAFGKLFLIQRPETITADNVLPPSVDAFDTQTEAPNWEQTLAVISQMDIVISGDTTITHMAGALGKKTIVLLPHAPHPYWADLKEIATWYPSVRVFPQRSYNSWKETIEDAKSALRNELPSTSDEISQLLQRGQQHYEQTEYAEALLCIRELYAQNYTTKELKLFEAECLYYTGKAQEALSIMQELYRTDSKK